VIKGVRCIFVPVLVLPELMWGKGMSRKLFSGLFVGKEIKDILGALDGFDVEFKKISSFDNVKQHAKKVILKNREEIKRIMLRDNVSPVRAAYSWINNISGDMLESGQFHIYRGTLDVMGKELLNILTL
jgi:hypothetical protein